MIDIEFYGRKTFRVRYQTAKEKAVTNAWKNYNDHLNNKQAYESEELWIKDADGFFVKLLYAMSISLGYDYDEVQLKRDCYRPEAHYNLERMQSNVLAGLAEILTNKTSLPVTIKNFQVLSDKPLIDRTRNTSSEEAIMLEQEVKQ